MMYSRTLVRGFIAALLLFTLAPDVNAQQDERCFTETGQCIRGRIREFWEQNGGLPVFGFPVAAQAEELIEGKPYQVQWFERNRLELHPENARPYDVLLGRLGVDRLAQQGRDWFTFPKGSEQAGCQFFAQTGHSVCGDILAAYRANGLEIDGRAGKTDGESLALFGQPISEPAMETNASGFTVLTQWFERARFEVYPENAPQFRVQFGLLGNEIRANGATPQPPAPQPPAPPAPPAPQPQPPTPPSLPAPSFYACQSDATVAPHYPVRIVGINKGSETVVLKNVSPEPVNLDGWRMCSIRGNQEHTPIGGMLAPNEERSFVNAGGQIWSNDQNDPGALYNANGQLVSSWAD